MKNRLLLFMAGCCLALLSSCLKSDDEDEIELAPNCLIVSFTLKSDSVAGLSDVKFAIDQREGRIFNQDSMPVGTEIEKVVCTLQYMASYAVGGVQVRQEAAGDTLAWWNGSDSLDFSKPVHFVVHAYDGTTTKEYKAQVNIHRVVPDSMVWALYSNRLPGGALAEQQVVTHTKPEGEKFYYMYVRPVSAAPAEGSGAYALYRSSTTDPNQWESVPLTGWPAEGVRLAQITQYEGFWYVPAVSGRLYRSADGATWEPVEEAPSVKYLLGNIPAGERQTSLLCGVIEEAGVMRFASMNTDREWTAGDEVPAVFPLTGFGASVYEAMRYQYLMIVAGKDRDGRLQNASWATSNGRQWVLLSDEGRVPFDAREGVMLTPYDGRLFLIGGIDQAGKGLKDMYTSTDYGVTWTAADSLVILPDAYVGRGFSSVQVNEEQYLFLFGGKTSPGGNELNQIWRGRINRLAFGL